MSVITTGCNSNGKYIKLARIVSNLISPPMVFAVLGFILSFSALPNWQGLVWGAVYGFFISLSPLLVVIYMYRKGRVKDLHISDTRQRRIPYLVSFSGALITFLLLQQYDGPENLSFLALSNVFGLGVLGIINNYWLISNHMASITSLVLILGLEFGILVGVLLSPLIILVYYARCALKRHTPGQLIAGTFVAIVIVGLMVQLGIP